MPDSSLDRASAAVGELSVSVRALTSEVERAEQLRGRKIKVIQKMMYVLVPAIVLLVILAFVNFITLTRVSHIANDSRSTNSLLLGCLQPHTTCSDNNKKQTALVFNQIRQTQFVIAVCQRQNSMTEDPEGVKMQACIRSYYPGFTLPTKAAPTP